ncbi:MAG: ABC-type cobalt transport system, permease component CbiQ [Planctomycetota bacterium]|nr:ABC-type cobalt transport system, permease component CbiQ [Planctomycetota bacterium]
MRFDGFDVAPGDGPLDTLDPRRKLVAALAFIIVVVVTPIPWWWAMPVEAIVLLGVVWISRLRPLPLLRRWLAFVPLVGFLALMVATGHPQRARLGLLPVAGVILIKNSLAFVTILVLGGVTPFPRLLDGMRRLGAPRVLVATLHFMYRYIHVLGTELARMVQARRSRSFRRGGPDWGLLTGLIGVLFLRAMERGERVHAAMVARGWDGTIHHLDGEADGR